MKSALIFLCLLILTFTAIMASNTENNHPVNRTDTRTDTTTTGRMANRLRIRIGSSTFTATLLKNATVTAFKAQLPITLSMKELNGNEKFTELTNSLLTSSSAPGTIQTGDLMLYGSNTLVLFYKTFQTSYRYTRLGRINNPSGLAAALGTGNIAVSVELE